MGASDLPDLSGEFSRTAVGVAYLRAAHMLLDPPPHVLDDPVAVALVGSSGRRRILERAAEFDSPGRRGLRAHVVLRSRFAEDRLRESVARGVRQCVILGAGLDTFACRQPGWAGGLRIAEMDAPATQALKRRMLAAAGLPIPGNTRLCEVDFEREALDEALERHGISRETPAFFSWLGVTMYLGAEAVRAVLACLGRFAAGSEVVLTYARPPGETVSPLQRRAEEVGEPWLSHFEPAGMEAVLREAGFREVEFLTLEGAARYFGQGPGALSTPRNINIVAAIR